MVHKSAIKPRIVIKSAGSEPMRIPVIYPKDKLLKLKKQEENGRLVSRKLLSKVTLNLFLLSVHIAPNFATTITCFPQAAIINLAVEECL